MSAFSFMRHSCRQLRLSRGCHPAGVLKRAVRGSGAWGREASTRVELETIQVEQHNAVQILKLNRPDKMNALSTTCCRELLESLKSADENPEIHVSILTGNGKVFCAGADIEEMSTWTAEQVQREQKFYEFTDIQELQKPTIAAVNGAAIAGGCELAMLCDILIASENAFFCQPEPNVGLIPGMGGTQRLIRAVGKSKAMEMILTGDTEGLTAAQALQYGLISRITPEGKVLDEALKIAERIAERSSPIIIKAKRCINMSAEQGLTASLKEELNEFWSCFELQDSKEGLRAFLEKRKPLFKHR